MGDVGSTGASITRDDVIRWLIACAAAIKAQRAELNRLDAAIGDADHGENLDRGFSAVVAALPDVADKDLSTIFKKVGMTLVSTVGGASGPLYGTFFLQAGAASAGQTELQIRGLVDALEAGRNGVQRRGHAILEEKTMVDALIPAVGVLQAARDQGTTLHDALDRAAGAAEAGAAATIPLIARKGRASYLGERSIGHQDPGATSTALIFRALASCY